MHPDPHAWLTIHNFERDRHLEHVGRLRTALARTEIDRDRRRVLRLCDELVDAVRALEATTRGVAHR